MIIKQELVKRIKDYFDLNIYETKVWLALLSKGVASARETADISGVPRSRTYDVLESLEKRGFAITRIGKPVKYISVKPTEVIEKMKSNMLNNAQEKVKSLSKLKSTAEYTELEQLHNSGFAPIKSHEITGFFKGRSNIMAKLRELFDNAKNEVLICTSALDFEDKGRILVPALEKFKKCNVKVRVALSGEQEKVKKLALKHNLKVKHTDSLARFYITDKKEILFMITPETDEEEMGVWLQSNFFTSSLTNMVEYSLRNGSAVNVGQ